MRAFSSTEKINVDLGFDIASTELILDWLYNSAESDWDPPLVQFCRFLFNLNVYFEPLEIFQTFAPICSVYETV